MPRESTRLRGGVFRISGGRHQRQVSQYRHRLGAWIRGRMILKAAPKAQETISYGMPAFRQDGGILVWFAPHKNHIGFYPGASGIAAFAAELAQYKFAKGSVQFPIDEPLPLALIRRMVQFRVKERLAKQKKSPRSGRSV